MTYKWSARSLKAMAGIHPDLRKVCDRALELTEIDFVVTEGKRSIEQQRKYVAAGASKTLKSRHLTGHAVDFVAIVEGKVKYYRPAMAKIAEAFKQASKELRIPIVWGGDWKMDDTPHIELAKSKYPA